MSDTNIAIIGAGSWGTALAVHLSNKLKEISLWIYENDLYEIIRTERENKWFLPGYKIPKNIKPENSLELAVKNKSMILMAVPTPNLRKIVATLKDYIKPDTLIINASKGIEIDSLEPCHKIIHNTLSIPIKIATISGPTFAKEIANQVPSAILAASESQETTTLIQEIFTSKNLKVFTSEDIIGVEIGGALKNVIAIATGISDGLGLGFNTRAALITRGLVEIARIGTMLGAKPETFNGLSGLGDLVLTCTGDLSRNRQLGIKLGKGESLEIITKEMKTVAEGISTVQSAQKLIQKLNIQASIMEETYKVLHKNKSPKEALGDLMKVPISNEFSGIKGIK